MSVYSILVNCAGVLVQRPMAMETFEGIWRQVEVNFKGVSSYRGPLVTVNLYLITGRLSA